MGGGCGMQSGFARAERLGFALQALGGVALSVVVRGAAGTGQEPAPVPPLGRSDAALVVPLVPRTRLLPKRVGLHPLLPQLPLARVPLVRVGLAAALVPPPPPRLCCLLSSTSAFSIYS